MKDAPPAFRCSPLPGLSLDAKDIDDELTPLIMALINGHYDAAGALIQAGADVNLSDKLGRTPLYSAVDDHTHARLRTARRPRKSTK